jgi:hypothetical protein
MKIKGTDKIVYLNETIIEFQNHLSVNKSLKFLKPTNLIGFNKSQEKKEKYIINIIGRNTKIAKNINEGIENMNLFLIHFFIIVTSLLIR